MLITIPDFAHDNNVSLLALESERDQARNYYFAHIQPDSMNNAQLKAWKYEHFALQLIMAAAQVRLDGESETRALIKVGETADVI